MVTGDSKGYSPVAFFLSQCPGRGDNDLISVGGNAIMRFSSPDNNAVFLPLHYVQIHIWVWLLVRSKAPIALDIGLRSTAYKVVLLKVLEILLG